MTARWPASLVLSTLLTTFVVANMNGDYPKPANALPGAGPFTHTGEYFDVLTPPITTVYSEVFWTQQDPVPLPADIVSRFHGKVIAITSWESTVVRVLANGTEERVPAYEQYNHHYVVTITGEQSQQVDIGNLKNTVMMPGASGMGAGDIHMGHWAPRPIPGDPNATSLIPTAQIFVQNNGNEHRKSFKWLPSGYAQLIESPTTFNSNQMMINTRNPNGGRGGPLPKNSRAPENATYSGLLECPCTTRIVRNFTDHVTQEQGTCADKVETVAECYTAAAALGLLPMGPNKTVTSATLPSGCLVLATGSEYEVTYNDNATSSVECGQHHGPPRSVGSRLSEVLLKLDLDGGTDIATVSITGPDGVFFAVGFNATSMTDEPYTIVVLGNGTVQERSLGDHLAGDLLAPSVKVISDVVKAGMRTVVMQRPLEGLTSQHFTFDPAALSISFINAVGTTPDLQYHGPKRASTTAILLEVGSPACVCRGKGGGSINGVQFSDNCMDRPEGDLVVQHNPSCDVATYSGGMYCCKHGDILLDADQQAPNVTDTFQLKYRFYFTEYDPEKTENAFFVFRQTEMAHGEYDVPQCPPGVPSSDCVHTITSTGQVKELIRPCTSRADIWCAPAAKYPASDSIKLLHASGHCHGPGCINMEIFDADSGQLICRIGPSYGTGDEAMDEEGYIAGIPPCIWGTKEEGLPSPPVLSLNQNLTFVKRANNTYAHLGVMAQWQMRGAWA